MPLVVGDGDQVIGPADTQAVGDAQPPAEHLGLLAVLADGQSTTNTIAANRDSMRQVTHDCASIELDSSLEQQCQSSQFRREEISHATLR